DLMLLALSRAAFAIPFSNWGLHTEKLGSLFHPHTQEIGISQIERFFGTDRIGTKRAHDFLTYAASHRGRNRVTDLSSPVPFRFVKTKPIGKAVQSGHFSYRHAARIAVVNRSRAREGPARRVRPRPKSIAYALRRELEETGYRFDLSLAGFGKSSARNVGVIRPHAGGQHRRVPIAGISVMPGIVVEAS